MKLFSKVRDRFNSRNGKKLNLPNEFIKSYYQSRTISDKRFICHAPFNNMYFNSLGDIANCWLTFDSPEQYTEDRTLKEIWFGEKFTKLRENIKNFDLSSRCTTCLHYLENKNHVNLLAKAYDNEYPLGDYPTMMEFELTNTCNLECSMCTGLLSSAIRTNREKLPKLKSPYGAKFVQELEEFIPFLHEARFNGGEPFLIKIYYDIWERIIAINPKCKIVVATNGTVLTKKVKDTLERGNFHINISIDSLIPERYGEIRVNGNLNQVIENFKYFKDYCAEKKRTICVMINPMRTNWEEMPNFVDFCNTHNVHLWFNSIIHPEELSLWSLPYSELQIIYDQLSAADFSQTESKSREDKKWVLSKEPVVDPIVKYNIDTYRNLINTQIKTWMLEAKDKKDVVIPKDKRAYFLRNLETYLEEKGKSSEKHDLILKIEQLEVLLEENQRHLLYNLLATTRIDSIYPHLLNNDATSLLLNFKQFVEKS